MPDDGKPKSGQIRGTLACLQPRGERSWRVSNCIGILNPSFYEDDSRVFAFRFPAFAIRATAWQAAFRFPLCPFPPCVRSALSWQCAITRHLAQRLPDGLGHGRDSLPYLFHFR